MGTVQKALISLFTEHSAGNLLNSLKEAEGVNPVSSQAQELSNSLDSRHHLWKPKLQGSLLESRGAKGGIELPSSIGVFPSKARPLCHT